MATNRGNTVVLSGTDVGSAYAFGVSEPRRERPLGLHLDIASADVSVQATAFFDFTTGVGSLWSNIQSGTNITSSGLYVVDGSAVLFQGYRVMVNSVAGHVTARFVT